ncbi:MFS transporter [Chondromyces crocatus]|uniref:Tetracycline resistance MFS efflux pump n=1 Tax=Chondromyces crocatus TaxID=52 RepID=A0A0K1EBE3_CHOCO|nr:MFS transporter [Chondromyces crocatus]AKT38201.1 tetracycline resistance MFS efflux pump [Chondromyces crocatus]
MTRDPSQDRDAVRALVAVAFTIFLDLVGFGIILPVLPYFTEAMGASAAEVALLATTFSIAQLAFSPVLGRLSDRFGRRPVLLISIAGSVVSAALLWRADTLAMVFTSRAIAGMSKANLSTAHAYVADLVTPENRAKIMGRLSAAASLGLVAGPAIGALLAVDRMPTLPFLVTAILSAVNLLLVAWWVPEIPAARRRGSPARAPSTAGPRLPSTADSRLARTPSDRTPSDTTTTTLAWLLVAGFLFFFGYTGIQATFALFTKRLFGWGSWETGWVLMLMGASMALAQGLAIGRIVTRFGEASAAALGFAIFLAGAACLGFSALQGSLGALLAGSVVLVVGAGVLQTCLTALVASLARAESRGLLLGFRDAAGAFGRIFGPMIAGFTFEHLGITWPSLLAGASALLALLIVLGLGDRTRLPAPQRARNT